MRFGIANANIAQSLAVPATLIVVFVAVMVAAPLDCIRSPVLLLLRGLAVLLMVTPSALIVMSALFRLTPVVLAALTALTPPAPAGMTTLTPDNRWPITNSAARVRRTKAEVVPENPVSSSDRARVRGCYGSSFGRLTQGLAVT